MIKKNIIFSGICLIFFIAFCILMVKAVLNMEVKTSSENIKNIPEIVIDAGHGGCVLTMVVLYINISLKTSNISYLYYNKLCFLHKPDKILCKTFIFSQK